MHRLLNPFVLTVTAILAAAYSYLAWRLTSSAVAHILLAFPFVLVWSVPVVYWSGDRDRHGRIDQAVQFASYLSMGWLSFLLIFSLARDAVWVASTSFARLLAGTPAPVDLGVPIVIVGSLGALAVGLIAALRGPHVRHVDVPIGGLHDALEGFRIVQISDLHVGLTIRGPYVRRVVAMAKALAPDLIAVTGDVVDGPVSHYGRHLQALAELPAVAPSFYVLGNHEYYAGAAAWVRHFQSMALHVLLNDHAIVRRDGARMLVGGVTDPAAHYSQHPPRADLAAGNDDADFRLLLAHNPRLAPAGAKAGFQLQLSGHTHAGQFFPWTLAVRLVHTRHVAGLSREGSMWVYVSAGTGTWGPPVRFGTRPELTVLRLVRGKEHQKTNGQD
ncbi:MAG TPA: metallophosphoesterase [Burkholderiales bacterium]|nr:metallophosphoesterase [Burkholderiales bacterium]